MRVMTLTVVSSLATEPETMTKTATPSKGNTPTTSNTAQVRRVRTAPGELSQWQPAPAVVPVTVKSTKAPKLAQVASTALDRPAWASLSFIKTKPTRYGVDVLDWLNVPAQTYGEGWITGLRVMDELMAHINACRTGGRYGAEHALQSVIAAACAELAKPMSTCGEGRDKRGAAQAVMHCLTRFMVSVDMVSTGGNRCLPVRQWLRHEIDYQTRMHAELAQEEAERKAAWAKRMQAARKAKKQAKAASQGVEVAA